MSRPKPKVILEKHDKKRHRTKQIVEAENIFAVHYDGKLFNYKNINPYLSNPSPKYYRISFISKGSAFLLAGKLNVIFKTDKFEVYKMAAAELVTE